MAGSRYRLNLFEESLEIDNTHKRGEAFLKPAAQLALKHLWKNWQTEKRPAIFSFDFIKLLWKHQNSATSFYNAIFVEHDPFFLQTARRAVQESLASLCEQFHKNPPKTDEDLEKAQLALHNTLALYAMFCPTPEQPITIPQYIDGKWEIVTYTVTPIELTPKKGGWLNFLSEKDRLFSYGLTPLNHAKAHPILLHCGTGWGTAQGHAIQYLADIWPNKTPGEIFFDWRYQDLKKWINQAHAKTEQKVIISGQSLGGSLAYLTALAFPDHIEKAYCLNPPGMAYDYPSTHPYFGEWEKLPPNERLNKVYIQKQDDDIVSKCGIFKKDFKLVKIKALENNPHSPHSVNALLTSHARSFMHCDNVEWSMCDMPEENTAKRRLQNNKWLYRTGRTIAFYGFLTPYFFLFRPIKHFIVKHAYEILLCSLALTLLCTIPPLGALLSLPFIPNLGSVFLSALLPSLAFSQIISATTNYGHDFFFNQRKKLNAYIEVLQSLAPIPRKGKLLYDALNILTLGLLNVAAKAINKLFVKPFRHMTTGRTKACEIHTHDYYQNASDFSQHEAPSFMSKLQLASIICLFYVIATPLKFILNDVPGFIIKTIKKVFSPSPKQEETSPSGDAVMQQTTRPRVSPTPPVKTHFGRFFSCCYPSEEKIPSPEATHTSSL